VIAPQLLALPCLIQKATAVMLILVLVTERIVLSPVALRPDLSNILPYGIPFRCVLIRGNSRRVACSGSSGQQSCHESKSKPEYIFSFCHVGGFIS
jgi:hypothetical protein